MMNELGSTMNFYADLPSFNSFGEVASLSTFQTLPDDWTLLISDVSDSTKAIERGEYKSVNMVGAASIICILNISSGIALPFMFGGDGGLIAVPSELVEPGCRELKRLQNMSQQMFGLGLRAAAIPVGALRAAGADTTVKKFELSKGNCLAMFAGTGAATADEWLKVGDDSNGFALVPDPQDEAPDLEGLSCRWEPLKTRNGVMLSLIVIPQTVDPGTEITSTSEQLGKILKGQIADFAPAHKKTMKFRFPPKGLRMEIASGAKHSTVIKRTTWGYFTSLMQYLCERFDVKIGDYDGATYREELKTNTDFRKYDGALRMVLDVSVSQADEIEKFLDQEYQAQRLHYGIWRSQEALMTCLLFNLAESQHIHFIDGADGGYAMAAKGLKERMAAGQKAGSKS